MNKNELAPIIQEKFNIRHYICADIVDEIFNVIAGTLAEGEPVYINNFGKFTVTKTNPRTCRNPKTGEAVQVPAKMAVKFKPGKGLKEGVN